MKKQQIIFPLTILLVLLLGLWFWNYRSKQQAESITSSVDKVEGTGPGSPLHKGQDPVANNDQTLPRTLLLKVPFTPQAPTANWDQLHNEACEEASSLMAGLYFGGNNNETIPADQAEAEITKLVNWEQANYGYSLDTNSPETAKMIENNYGLKTQLLNNFTIDDLKSQLNQGRLVLISTDGRLLGNPNYRRPGPPHHMLVIKGYDPVGIVTNDPGTRNGRNYTYDFSTIYNAAGDWDHGRDAVNLNRKVAIIVWKQ